MPRVKQTIHNSSQAISACVVSFVGGTDLNTAAIKVCVTSKPLLRDHVRWKGVVYCGCWVYTISKFSVLTAIRVKREPAAMTYMYIYIYLLYTGTVNTAARYLTQGELIKSFLCATKVEFIRLYCLLSLACT